MKYYIFGLITLFLIVYSCANPGYPTGGAKDEDPPVIKKSTPEPNALNYNEDEVIIEFNELIKLDNVNTKFIASPPLKKRPVIDARGAKLRVKFDEELQENATYTLDFANAIQDNNEGNEIPSFVFSFSTGEVVDSFAIMGNLWDADDLSPVEGALVMIHSNLNDTAFTHDIPLRLAKSDVNGFFAIRNLSPGKYRLYALEDGNRNYMFDQPGEHIAWSDSIIVPSMEYVEMPDTIAPDSVVFNEELVYSPNDLKLFMFKEKSVQQYFTGEERSDSNKMSFTFNLPVENFSVKPVGVEYDEDWAVFEPSLNNDTISLWIADSTLYKRDTLNMAFSYLGLDTLSNPEQKNDTIKMYYFSLPKKEPKRRKKGEKKVVKTLKMKKASSSVDVYSSFSFTMPTPVKNINTDAISLFERVDTLLEKRDIVFEQDTFYKRRYTVQTTTKWNPGAKYLFVADSASIEDIYGLKCDSIGKEFTVKSIDSYGLLLIDVTDPQENWLAQLLDKSGNIIQQKYVPKSGKLSFQYVKPGNYDLKMVVDLNINEQWDTGKYSDKIQPEEVFYYPAKVDVRANWDVEIFWSPGEFDIYDFVTNNRKPKKRDE
ncbi:hypothetical protein E9993_10295 [Labilibacter sediminis]|nr:hypothetical protein E9993_10295 [Labilibacter sediminis]